jgi:hypothetical protein
VVAVCEHGADCHTGLEPSMASAPEASRAWLLIEHPGPWPHEAADAAQPAPLAALVQSAEEFGVRVHLIRRPGRRQAGDTHVGGHRFAANLVLLPHGLYYGPVTVGLAAAAIDAYQRGSVVVDRYRGRAGQPRADQEAEYARLPEGGALSLGLSACGLGAPG